ncbi:MAG: LLM class flavin-dependent oxidoreductase [Beijerinckiaceae bacterium]|jgi:dimethylsulfone monooxygenase|nr:LLM class flavin-dependent oxidoreductase [Beijerinckiaceae bacterium]
MAGYFGTNAFKLGLFGVNCSGGCTFSDAPERWTAEWDDIVEVTLLADRAGLEFTLPIARWRALGESYVWSKSYETFTQAAALGALTKNINMIVTAHVPLVAPVMAAKSIITVDHVTKGRAAINLVCGWNAQEFAMHGVTLDGDKRYEQGDEWVQIFNKLMAGGPDFDWDGEFYHLKHMTTDPLPLQKPRPPIISAASSSSGQDFAARSADILFTAMHNYDMTRETITRLQGLAAKYNRKPDIFVESMFVVRPTRKEAEEFYHYAAEEHADPEALAYFQSRKIETLAKTTASAHAEVDRQIVANMNSKRNGDQKYAGHFPGMHLCIGTPDDVVEELQRMHAMGIGGSALVFLNFLKELPYFTQEVLPRMEKAGLRNPFDR